jgi:hypothetical protein
MRNEVPDAGENVYNSVVARRNRRRKQVIIGVVGLAVLGAGTALVTDRIADSNSTVTADTAALAPAAPEVLTDSPSASAAPSSASASASASATSASAAPSESPAKSRKDSIAEVRELARQPNNNVRRPPAKADAFEVDDEDLKITSTGSLKDDKATLKVVSARQDLTGQRELSWAADEGKLVGKVRCTQKVRFAEGAPAVEKPTLLLCWRTSEAKSVYTLAVNLTGKPSTKRSVTAVNKEWKKLG